MAAAACYPDGRIVTNLKGSAYGEESYNYEHEMVDNVLAGRDTSLLSYALVARALGAKITIKFTPLHSKLFLAV